MWNNDGKTPQSADATSAQASTSSVVEMPVAANRSSATPQLNNQHSVIGKSITIKGEIAATDPVYIYGKVEGTISAPAHRVTVNKEGRVTADVTAREVVIMGDVRGNLNSSERVEIRGDGSLTGNLVTHRISIEEGATLKGKIDVRKPQKIEKPEVQEEPQPIAVRKQPDHESETWADLAVSEIA
ncbi:MAG TPA: polymer-forming cytoskeletal protein [Terracidiphilus sp.]|jgi:cytoskeletal protein CcmA (bactofilin family)